MKLYDSALKSGVTRGISGGGADKDWIMECSNPLPTEDLSGLFRVAGISDWEIHQEVV